jgi:hypothetical protein
MELWMFVSTIALVALIASTQSAFSYADADNLDQAVAMISVEIKAIEESRLYCAREVEKARPYFDHYTMYWETQNKEEMLAVETRLSRRSDRAHFESLRDSAVSTAMVAFRAAATVSGPEKSCAATFQAIASGDRNVAHQTPKASDFLKSYLRNNPPAAEVVRKRDDVMGCEIQLSNKKIDLDSARKTCTCVTNLMHERASPEELAEIDKVAREHGDVAHLSSMSRLAPDLARCVSGAPAPTGTRP